MSSMEILIPGRPVPKLRARLSKYAVYDPQKEIKDWYRAFLMAEMNKRFNAEDKEEASPAYFISRCSAFRVELVFCFTPPPSWPQKRKKPALQGFLYHTQKPDIDNLEKFVLDCMNEIVFSDDKGICELHSKKIYGEENYTKIQIKGLQ